MHHPRKTTISGVLAVIGALAAAPLARADEVSAQLGRCDVRVLLQGTDEISFTLAKVTRERCFKAGYVNAANNHSTRIEVQFDPIP